MKKLMGIKLSDYKLRIYETFIKLTIRAFTSKVIKKGYDKLLNKKPLCICCLQNAYCFSAMAIIALALLFSRTSLVLSREWLDCLGRFATSRPLMCVLVRTLVVLFFFFCQFQAQKRHSAFQSKLKPVFLVMLEHRVCSGFSFGDVVYCSPKGEVRYTCGGGRNFSLLTSTYSAPPPPEKRLDIKKYGYLLHYVMS